MALVGVTIASLALIPLFFTMFGAPAYTLAYVFSGPTTMFVFTAVGQLCLTMSPAPTMSAIMWHTQVSPRLRIPLSFILM